MSAFPVLLYHSVSAPDPGPGGRWTVAPAALRRHAALVRASGRVSLAFSELCEGLRTGHLPDRPVAVTFDDGFADNRAAIEVLAGEGLHATVFVTASYLGMPGMLTPGGLRELAAHPLVEIGAHSVTHPYLDEIPSQAAAREIRDSRSALEDVLGSPVTVFAYPHGAHSAAVRRLVVEHGYTGAAAVKNALTHRFDDPFAVARFTVTRDTDDGRIERLLDGDGAPVSWSGERLRTRAWRTARIARRRLAGARA